jgi:hypothetical protein
MSQPRKHAPFPYVIVCTVLRDASRAARPGVRSQSTLSQSATSPGAFGRSTTRQGISVSNATQNGFLGQTRAPTSAVPQGKYASVRLEVAYGSMYPSCGTCAPPRVPVSVVTLVCIFVDLFIPPSSRTTKSAIRELPSSSPAQ